MAVMHKMRENMTYILFFLLIMFVASMTIGGLVGGANILDILSGRNPDTILAVNDQQISYDQYNRVRQNQLEDFRQKNNTEPSGYQLQQLEDQIWQGMIIDVLKQQLIDKYDLNVTNEEIKYYIFTNPHPIIKMDKNFQNEKNEFDPARYQAALANQEADLFWQYKEQQLRTFVPYEKLDAEIKATIRVTDAELKDEYKRRNVKVKAKYVSFDYAKYPVADDQISDSEIRSYYNEHKDDFKQEEQRKLHYVLFPTTPSEKDSNEIRNLAQTLLDSVRHGADFAQLAEIYSDDPGSAEKGGDLGYFGRGMMVKPFEDAAFAAKKGEIVGPVETVHGLHIIKVEDRKRENKEEKVKARHILLKFKASRETEDTARDMADYFSDKAASEGFVELAQAENIKIDTTTYFRNTGFIPGLGMQKHISIKAFHSKPGEVSRVYYIENRGYVVFEVADIQEDRIQPFDEVKSRIMNLVRREKQKVLAKEDAQAFHVKLTAPEEFEKVAAADSLKIQETDFFTIDAYVAGVGRDPKFNGAAFHLDVNEFSLPVEGSRGYFVIKVVDKQDYDAKKFAESKDQLRQELMQNKLRMYYSDWVENLKKQAEIKDYRYVFY